jgi:ABC-type uncharacterized transport system YnjBCD ATPase subunit
MTVAYAFAKLAVFGAVVFLLTVWVESRVHAARRRQAERAARAQLELARRAGARVAAERRAPVTVVRTSHAQPKQAPLRRVS